MKLYCLGDSLTYGFGVRPRFRWTNLAAQSLQWEVKNLGVSGDTTSGMLVRLYTAVLPDLSPHTLHTDSRVLVMGGCNDIFYSGSSDSAQVNMGAMLHGLMSAGVNPIVGIPLPIVPDKTPSRWREAVDFRESERVIFRYCTWLKCCCRAFSVPYIDFRQDFLEDGGGTKEELLLDGLHPTPEGHRLMAARLIRFLRETEQEKQDELVLSEFDDHRSGL